MTNELFCGFLQDSVSDVMELLKRQEDLEAMIQAQSDRFVALQQKKTQVGQEHEIKNRGRMVEAECLFFCSEGEEAGSSWSWEQGP